MAGRRGTITFPAFDIDADGELDRGAWTERAIERAAMIDVRMCVTAPGEQP